MPCNKILFCAFFIWSTTEYAYRFNTINNNLDKERIMYLDFNVFNIVHVLNVPRIELNDTRLSVHAISFLFRKSLSSSIRPSYHHPFLLYCFLFLPVALQDFHQSLLQGLH